MMMVTQAAHKAISLDKNTKITLGVLAADRWTGRDMVNWVLRARIANPELDLPDPVAGAVRARGR